MCLLLHVLDKAGRLLSQAEGDDEIWLVHPKAYEAGDHIEISTDKEACHLVVQLGDAMPPVLCFLRGGKATFEVPFDEAASVYSPRAFAGETHYLTVRQARPEECSGYRNLAFNVYDQKHSETLFPHAMANVETRNEYGFAVRNAIDGSKANDNHGFWPYTSWGINQDPDASMVVNFGRDVITDRIVIYLRADFPHDAWWTTGEVDFSDGSHLSLDFSKTGAAQEFTFPEKRINQIRLHSLVKADDPSPFPALTGIEVWGRDLAVTGKDCSDRLLTFVVL